MNQVRNLHFEFADGRELFLPAPDKAFIERLGSYDPKTVSEITPVTFLLHLRLLLAIIIEASMMRAVPAALLKDGMEPSEIIAAERFTIGEARKIIISVIAEVHGFEPAAVLKQQEEAWNQFGRCTWEHLTIAQGLEAAATAG